MNYFSGFLDAELWDGILTSRTDSNNYPALTTTVPFARNTCALASDADNRKSEKISTRHIDPFNPRICLYSPPVSLAAVDSELSKSTLSSPPSIYGYLKRATDELQHVSSTQGVSCDEHSELEKKEKKRERNRQAAQKCRTRKLTRIADLQRRVNELQGKNKNLSNIAECLKTEIAELEGQLNNHHIHGCVLTNRSIV